MSIVAGMDLGHGSQVKVVTTNYLFVNVGSSPTDTAVSRFLQVVNTALVQGSSKTDLRQKPFQFDYIMCDGNCPTITSPTILDATSTTTVPVLGPSPSVLGGQADLAAHQDSAADIGRSANGQILAVLSASAGTVVQDESSSLFDTFTGVNMAGLTDDSSVLSHLQSELLAAQLTGTTGLSTLDVTDIVAEIAAESPTALTLSAAVANLNASYVAAGNADGTTATTLADVTADNDKLGVMSITALVKTNQ